VSLRGHGDSSKPSSGYGIDDLASDLVPFLDALDIERATLVGHSGSCLVARRVALDAPERVSGLVLEASPTTLHGHPQLQEFVDRSVRALRDPVTEEFARSFVADTATDALPAELVETLVVEVRKVPRLAWQEMFTSLLAADDTGDLSRIAAPSLLVWGDADRLIPASMQHELLRRLPRSALVTYQGVGHTPRWEQPARFADDVVRFANDTTR
jgi:pimeloyl-ACP methyl ester carboxylesterase